MLVLLVLLLLLLLLLLVFLSRCRHENGRAAATATPASDELLHDTLE